MVQALPVLRPLLRNPMYNHDVIAIGLLCIVRFVCMYLHAGKRICTPIMGLSILYQTWNKLERDDQSRIPWRGVVASIYPMADEGRRPNFIIFTVSLEKKKMYHTKP